MQESKFSTKKNSSAMPVFVGGVIIAALGAGVGVQFLRAQNQAIRTSDEVRAELGRTDVLDEPALRVNGQTILRRDLAQECLEQFGHEVMENVINRTIIQQACAEKGVTITDGEIINEIDRNAKKLGVSTGQLYKLVEDDRGLTPLQYQRDVIWPLLALRKLAGKNVEITREMMQEAYADSYGPRVKARMIFFDKVNRGTEVLNRVTKDPELFEDLAREYSVEPNSRALGGIVPPIRRFSGAHEDIRKTAFRFKENEIGKVSPLIQIGTGQYVIMKFEGRTEPVDHDPQDVQAALQEQLMEREVQRLVAETFGQLKQDARIDNYLTGENSSPIRRTAASSDDNESSAFGLE